jgi:hypothetical protein
MGWWYDVPSYRVQQILLPRIRFWIKPRKLAYILWNKFLYAYNYNVITSNIRLRLVRYLYPVINVLIFSKIYWYSENILTWRDYKT